MLERAGVKNMLAGEQQAAVTVAVEGLMEARPVPELEAFATYDPKVGPSVPIMPFRHTYLQNTNI